VQLKQAVEKGICKLNVFTELFSAYQQASARTSIDNLEDVSKRNFIRRSAVFEKLFTYFELSNSQGKASNF